MDPDDVQDRLLLRQLVEQYAKAADTRDPTMFAGVFTDDATLFTATGEITGRDKLLGVAPRLARYRVTMHLIGNHSVEFGTDTNDAESTGTAGPDTATGETYCIARHVYETDNGDRVYVMHIRYDDEYRRQADGWRIASRRLNLLWDEDHPRRSDPLS